MIAQLDRHYVTTRPTKALSRLISYALFEGRPLTTHGQWMNALILTLYSLEKRLPITKRINKPIFILGTGRSGTTILGMILSVHRDVGFLNEPKALWHSICPYEDLIGSYSRGDARYLLDAKDATSDMIKFAHRIYGSYLAVVFSKRVVDKYPELIFRVPFVRSIFPDAKFLILVRNGWDTCSSIDEWSKRHGSVSGKDQYDWWGVNDRKWNLLIDQIVSNDPYFDQIIERVKALSNHRDRAAVEWIATMRQAVKLFHDMPNCTLRVTYEHLSTRPLEIIGEIADFCELQPDNKMFLYAGKVLKPTKSWGTFKMDPSVKMLFDETSANLGYTS